MYMAKNTVKSRFKSELPPNFVRHWRKFRGLSQESLAERLGTSHATISRVERDKVDWRKSRLYAIAEALGTDPASLLIRDPTDPEGIWTVWDHAKPAERRKIVQMAKLILGTGTDG